MSSGTAIADITDYYLASQESSGITPDTAGWTTEIQETSLAKNYLWNYNVITFPDDTAEELDTKIISAYSGDIPGVDTNTIMVTFGQVIYGGIVDFVKGTVTVTHGYYSPYAGESLNEPWMSDRDQYVPGTLPTAGASVVYELDTPWVIQIVRNNIEITPRTTVSTADGTITLYYPSNIRDKIETLQQYPELPTESGTYKLNVEIIDNDVIYSWIKE